MTTGSKRERLSRPWEREKKKDSSARKNSKGKRTPGINSGGKRRQCREKAKRQKPPFPYEIQPGHAAMRKKTGIN